MTEHSLDTCLQLLADDQRRQIIQQLRPEGRSSVGELADEISGTGRERTAIQLHHNHLPKLQKHGILDYDERSGAVLYSPDARLEGLIDTVLADAPPPEAPSRKRE